MGNCLFLRARGWGIDRQMKTKLQIPGGMPGGGMVTGRIEPCIKSKATDLDKMSARLLRECEDLIASSVLFVAFSIDLLPLVFFPKSGNAPKLFLYSNKENVPI